jgi:secondary thiamine-phosphate synthase enzyme
MEHNVKTRAKDEFINITSMIRQELKDSGVRNGIVVVFVPHTTAGITINENADPDVVSDMLFAFRKVFPESKEFKHFEGNSHAHIKASLMGSSVNLIIENGQLKLGTWQGVYFCEFDGPRDRKIYIKIMEG